MQVRFLKPSEYHRTIPLYEACFGRDPEFEAEYYGTEKKACTVSKNRIAVLEDAGKILSMVHLTPLTAESPGRPAEKVTYLLCVATLPECRHRGYMDLVMNFVTDALIEEKEPWCFLVAVNREIYRHLGFVHDWAFGEPDRALLSADEGLTLCSTKRLSDLPFTPPETLRRR